MPGGWVGSWPLGLFLNVGGVSDVVFSVEATTLADDSGRFVAEVEAVEL